MVSDFCAEIPKAEVYTITVSAREAKGKTELKKRDQITQRKYEMNTNNYTIRLEENKDYGAVENLVRESFWNVYRFYGKSGFDYARKFGIRYHDLPEGADDSFFLCKELIPGYLSGITGVYQTPQGIMSVMRMWKNSIKASRLRKN